MFLNKLFGCVNVKIPHGKPCGIFGMRMFVSLDKPNLLNHRVGAPAPTATVKVKKITKRAFDGRALHGVK